MEWQTFTLWWYVVLSFVGILFLPTTRLLFKRFYDQGYAFSKAIGILAITYTTFILGTTKLAPFTPGTLIGICIVAGLFNLYVFRKTKDEFSFSWIWLVEEVMFFVAIFVWAYVRGQEPSIRGLEKFMDFGFTNSALRGDYFPPKDIWLAGKSINYYYFGHITGAVLTRLSNIPSYITYNLILATIFALGITQSFSLGLNLAYVGFKKNLKLAILTAILATFLINLGGNLHTVYSLTEGYPNEDPVPVWQLPAKYKLADLAQPIESFNKLSVNYWYPNATRFIPFTIHEFPIYSYVVADLHGHVYDIPFVLLTLALLWMFFEGSSKKDEHIPEWLYAVIFGFMTAIHYMTNAFDAPIYLILTTILFFVVYRPSRDFLVYMAILVGSFYVFSKPFTMFFEPFATGVGINCAPGFLTAIKKWGPFLFEAGNCQVSPWWMLASLWGFFWFNFVFFGLRLYPSLKKSLRAADYFVLMLFAFGTLLIAIPEFAYAKDIYPSHFRANTMFKLGYQAFMMMGLASAYTFVSYKEWSKKEKTPLIIVYFVLAIPLFLLVAIYPSFAINSYYGNKPTTSLHGTQWLDTTFPENAEIVQFFNTSVKGQPNILEAQGDSYTDYNVISAYTGLPTVAGWWVHEWLWRGSSDAVGKIIPEIQEMYQGTDRQKTAELLRKYKVEYVVIGPNEKEKYPQLLAKKFEALGQSVFTSKSGASHVYKITLDR
jgi:YYY domain-containing protein